MTKKINFKLSQEDSFDNENAESMFRDIKGRSIQHIWSHQADILRKFHQIENSYSDISFELPTGCGKTLIGLVIAEWRRKKMKERVLYLCPTKQLANQVGMQSDQYGIKSHVLIGKQKDYDPGKVADWQSLNNVVISTYSSLFNSNPKLNNPDLIILDDAHAAENYLSNFWSLSISRYKHEELYHQVIKLFRLDLNENLLQIIESNEADPYTKQTVDLLPQPFLYEKYEQLVTLFESYLQTKDYDENIFFSYKFLANNIKNMQVYISWSEILFRPWIIPSQTYPPFANAKLRLYMSATFGSNGDLERMMGISKIQRITPPDGWERQSTGRRLFIFPNRNFEENLYIDWMKNKLTSIDRALIITPNSYYEENLKVHLSNLSHDILTAVDIEESLDEFTKNSKSLLLLKGRYDGIDLPGDDCRYLFVIELPKGLNLQEMFFWNKLNIRKLFLNERIRTRLTQAFGRCTRNPTDYAVVILIGQELLDFCNSLDNQKYLHPELRAEIEFGLENSNVSTLSDLNDIIDVFLFDKKQWDTAEQDIIKRRNARNKESEFSHQSLDKITKLEINYQYEIWKENYEKALEIANAITDIATDRDFDAFRSIWYYHSACAAYHNYKISGNNSFLKVFSEKINRALTCNKTITWYGKLNHKINPTEKLDIMEESLNNICSELTNKNLEELGLIGKKYELKITSIEKNIHNLTNAKSFDQGLVEFGKILGFTSLKPDGSAAPDVVWRISSEFLLIFETKLDVNTKESITVTTCRQANSHIQWIEAYLPLYRTKNNYTIIVSNRENLSGSALPYIKNLYYLNTKDITSLFKRTEHTLNEIRSQLDGLDISERLEVIQKHFQRENLNPISIVSELIKTKLSDISVSN